MRRSPILLAVAVLLLFAVSSCSSAESSADSGSELPAGAEQLISDYEQAMEDGDVDAFYGTVTDDYQNRQYIYATATQAWSPELTEPDGVREAAQRVEFYPWAEASDGAEWIVTGEGPWFVSMSQTWTTEGRGFWDGNVTYVLVDRDGALKIGGYYYTGTVTNPES